MKNMIISTFENDSLVLKSILELQIQFFKKLFFFINPLPHGVLATFSLTAWGFMGPPKKDDISKENAVWWRHCGPIGPPPWVALDSHNTYPPSPPRHWEVIGYTKSFLLILKVMFKETVVWNCFLI